MPRRRAPQPEAPRTLPSFLSILLSHAAAHTGQVCSSAVTMLHGSVIKETEKAVQLQVSHPVKAFDNKTVWLPSWDS